MNVLLITGHFPPEDSGGAGRPYSLYKYLPRYGVNVYVITKNAFGELKDESNIYRFDSFANWRSQGILSAKGISRLISFIGYKLFHIYTDTWWSRQVLAQVEDIITKRMIDTVYVTYPSAEVLKLGLQIKAKYKVRLVSEFRDGLVFEPIVANHNALQRYKSAALERKIVAESDLVITIGNTISDYFRRKYKAKHIYTVFNGFDPEDFPDPMAALNRADGQSKTRIANFGSLSASRKGNRVDLFVALKRLKDEGRISPAGFELSFIGRFTEIERSLIAKYGLQELVRFYPSVSKKAGFKDLYENYNYLLFYGVEGEKSIISSKLVEYINLDLPIIGICKGNEAEEIIANTGTGVVCDFDAESIYTTFVRLIDQQIDYRPDKQEIEKFNRQRQAGQISELLLKDT